MKTVYIGEKTPEPNLVCHFVIKIVATPIIMIGYKPVSYTHLDVYKRQEKWQTVKLKLITLFARSIMEGTPTEH